MRSARPILGVVLLLGAPQAVPGTEALPEIGPAPAFELTTQDGERLALADLEGKVVAVTFVYLACPDVCPLLSAKLRAIQHELLGEAAERVHFVSVTMDPAHDTPAVLREYADALDIDRRRWSFLTGTEAEVREVANNYGVYFEKRPDGFIDHNLLTSIVDRSGTLRVQYMGPRFDPHELLADLRTLLHEARDAD